jgi:hypothetical protein
MSFGHMGWGAGPGGLLGYGAMALWWLLLIVGATADRRSHDGALEVLASRYARGEIGREEFQNRKRELGA